MNKILRRLLLFDLFEIRAKLPADTVRARVRAMAEAEVPAYSVRMTERGFVLAERDTKAPTEGTARGAFAPIVHAAVTESDGVTTVSGIARMSLQTLIPFAILYVCGLLSLILIPIIHVLLHFAFFKPAKRLRKAIEHAINEE